MNMLLRHWSRMTSWTSLPTQTQAAFRQFHGGKCKDWEALLRHVPAAGAYVIWFVSFHRIGTGKDLQVLPDSTSVILRKRHGHHSSQPKKTKLRGKNSLNLSSTSPKRQKPRHFLTQNQKNQRLWNRAALVGSTWHQAVASTYIPKRRRWTRSPHLPGTVVTSSRWMAGCCELWFLEVKIFRCWKQAGKRQNICPSKHRGKIVKTMNNS